MPDDVLTAAMLDRMIVEVKAAEGRGELMPLKPDADGMIEIDPLAWAALNAIADTLDVQQDSSWWWLSFCDADRPKGRQFLGVAIVQAVNFPAAVMEAHMRDCNPGGQIQGFELPPGRLLPVESCNRLLTKAEAEGLNV